MIEAFFVGNHDRARERERERAVDSEVENENDDCDHSDPRRAEIHKQQS